MKLRHMMHILCIPINIDVDIDVSIKADMFPVQDHVKSIEKTLVDIQTESTYLWTLGCTSSQELQAVCSSLLFVGILAWDHFSIFLTQPSWT